MIVMINCNYLGCNENILFNNITEEKNNPYKTTLRTINGRVLSCYNEYITDFESLQEKLHSSFLVSETNEIDSLKKCYINKTDTFKYVRGQIFEIQPDVLKNFCPYCLIGEPETIDHYITKNEFPEYSALIKNLIPCCYSCNNKKDEVWRKNKKRRYIHFYNDNFLHENFLHAKLILKRGDSTPQINFYLSKPNTMSPSDFRIVKMHFKDLKLLKNYNRKANSMISTEIQIIKQSIIDGIDIIDIRYNLNLRYTALTADHGINYWVAILYQVLANYNNINKIS